jgi:hypothetical protein
MITGVIAGRTGHTMRSLDGALAADASPSAPTAVSEAAGGRALAVALDRTAVWIALGVGLALLLRAPWFDAPLGRDEGGVALVARNWHGSGPFAYGSWFLDRPPLLPALYRLAGDSVTGIRLLGAVAASLIVVITTLLAVRIGGRRAAKWAALIAAVTASSYAIRSVYTPAELLAVVPSSASLLVLLSALEKRRLWQVACAGVLAAVALLIKQSFGDALVAGAVAMVATKATGSDWRETLRTVAAYAAGVGAVAIALVIWAAAEHVTAGSVWYAMFGFRLDAVSALSGPGAEGRLIGLWPPLRDSGLAITAVLALVGLVWLRVGALVRAVLLASLAAAVIGIVLGGSYWPHYLIALVPVTAAAAGALLGRHRWLGAIAICAIAASTVLSAERAGRTDSVDSTQSTAVTIGRYLHARAVPGETAYVLYARVNTLYYAGLRDPFPYNWSLMMRAVPGAQDRLRRLLASPRRPTWLVKADGTRSFGLDRSGATQRLLTLHYRLAGTVCGERVLLERGAPASPPPPPSLRCGNATREAEPS